MIQHCGNDVIGNFLIVQVNNFGRIQTCKVRAGIVDVRNNRVLADVGLREFKNLGYR